MSKKDELLSVDVEERLSRAGVSELKEMIVNAANEARKHNKLLKEDQQINSLKEDIKVLSSAYKDKIKACELIIDIALSRMELLQDEVS